MKLSKDNIIELVKKPVNGTYIQNGRKYESILRLFTEPMFEDQIKNESAWKEFLQFIRKTLGDKKAERICDYIQFPLSSTGLTKNIMKDLYKVFDAGNSFFSVEASKKNSGDKIKKAISRANITNWIENTGKEVLKNRPNTVVVIDKDEEGMPYLVKVNSERLMDFKLAEDNFSFEYIVFEHSVVKNEKDEEEVRISVYDEEQFFVILKIGDNYTIESATNHNIGYCPARMFISKPLNTHCKFSRDIPIANSISKLLEYQQLEIYHYYTDLYAAFPVVEMVRPTCDVENCHGGLIHYDEQYTEDGEEKTITKTKKCESCANRSQIGVGSKVLVDPPKEGKPSASGMFKFISNDIANLNYIREKVDRAAKVVQLRIAGMDSTMTKEAINELQVKGSFQSRSNVLLDIKENLDGLYYWIARTVCKTINPNKDVEINANFGTEWYLVSEDDLQKRYDTAKKSGIPESEIREIYFQLLETKYKGNPERLNKMKTINMVDPCPYFTQEEKVVLLEKGAILESEFIISQRMDNFIKRFEREELSINEFGSELEPTEKYKRILEILNKYADEHREKRRNDEAVKVTSIEE